MVKFKVNVSNSQITELHDFRLGLEENNVGKIIFKSDYLSASSNPMPNIELRIEALNGRLMLNRLSDESFEIIIDPCFIPPELKFTVSNAYVISNLDYHAGIRIHRKTKSVIREKFSFHERKLHVRKYQPSIRLTFEKKDFLFYPTDSCADSNTKKIQLNHFPKMSYLRDTFLAIEEAEKR